MPRTITVKGVGKASVKPDYIVLSIYLNSFNSAYDKAMKIAAWKIDDLNRMFKHLGFGEDAVKTVDFNVC